MATAWICRYSPSPEKGGNFNASVTSISFARRTNAVEPFHLGGGDDEDVEITVLRSLAAPNGPGGVDAGGITGERLGFGVDQCLTEICDPLVCFYAPLLKKFRYVTALHLATTHRG